LIDFPEQWPGFSKDSGTRLYFDRDGLLSDPSLIPGLKSARLNRRGRSIIIEYDPGVWRFEWVDELLDTPNAGRVQAIVEAMAEKAGLKVNWN
jgi:hypothetical protein